MSRIGTSPIKIPAGVAVEINGPGVKVTGPKGELARQLPEQIKISQEGDEITFTRSDETKTSKSLHGLTRSLVANMVEGVSQGFKKGLIVEGVGFKVNLSGSTLKLSLGYSHEVEYKAPEGIELSADKNDITVSGIDKQKVGQVAAEIRKLRKPEPYKGKGIRYDDEHIIRKEGKTAGAA